MSLDKISKLVSSLARSVEDNKKIATPVLAIKLAKCVEENPHDQTLGAMSRVIQQMTSNNNVFISRAELKSLYNKLYSRNTKFAELFSEELGLNSEAVVENKPMQVEASSLPEYEVSDPILANALQTAFDNTIPLKTYSKSLADKAIKTVANTLDAWSLKPSNMEIGSGNDKFIIVKADYETPKGITSVLVPVEVSNDKVLEASVFIGSKGPEDLNNLNIKSHLKLQTGKKLNISAETVLTALTKSASENREISNVELVLARVNSEKQTQSEFFTNQIVGQKVSTASVKDVELPKYDEFSSFEEKFASPRGVAEFNFGSEKVKIASDVISRKLIGFGYKNPQITVVKSDSNSIYYGVSLDAGKVAFTVPVKIENNKVASPSVMLCNGSLASFNEEAINKLYVNNATDFKVAAAASLMFGLKPSDLINNIRVAVAEGNHAKAEDALNVLANSGDEKAYATGFNVYMQGLSGTKTAEDCKCNMMIKSASSEHPICGHTGLPVHKVYQDKYGNCRPLYRRGMDETYEGAVFNNSKIFG